MLEIFVVSFSQQAKLMILDKQTGNIKHEVFHNIINYLEKLDDSYGSTYEFNIDTNMNKYNMLDDKEFGISFYNKDNYIMEYIYLDSGYGIYNIKNHNEHFIKYSSSNKLIRTSETDSMLRDIFLIRNNKDDIIYIIDKSSEIFNKIVEDKYFQVSNQTITINGNEVNVIENSFIIDRYIKRELIKDYISEVKKDKKLIEAFANLLNVKVNEIIYTSGASESNNLAIKGICLKYQNRGKHIISTELEHSSVIAPLAYLENLGFDVDFVKLDENGVVDLDDLKRLMRDDTILVSIASVNSEVGVRQPIEEISKIVKSYPKCYFHSDVTQSIGKEKIDLSVVDLASFSGQKFYGMKGIGGLIKRESINIEPIVHGGKSTTIYRSGTPATPLIASLAKALRLAYDDFDNKLNHVIELNNYLKELKGNIDN